jgi:autoinducer 2 (AI-2) kinase
VLGVTVRVPVVKEATALGAAICASVGAGLYPDIASASEAYVRWDKEYLPNPAHHAIYTGLYENWRKINEYQLIQADQGLTTHMWKAPGI